MDPIRNFRFVLSIPGLDDVPFSDATGFNATTDVIEYRTGGDATMRKFPGITKYGNITLKNGATKNAKQFYAWYETYVNGNAGGDELTKVNGTISAIDYAKNEVLAEWEFQQAWPIKYTAPDFTAKGNDVAIESLELVCEGLKRVS